ncbi:MAG: hypothetical protein WC962_10410 [Phycisphaerae bacterium]|jgi:hypothetical protein
METKRQELEARISELREKRDRCESRKRDWEAASKGWSKNLAAAERELEALDAPEQEAQ